MTGSDLSRCRHPVTVPEYPEAAIVSMSGWSTTAVPNVYTSPSQTGWSARNPGEDRPVFSAGTHTGALLTRAERLAWKQKTLAAAPRSKPRLIWGGKHEQGF